MIPGALSLGSGWPGCEAYHSTPPNAEAKNEWSYTSIPPRCLHGIHQDSLYFTLNITLTFSFLGMPQLCTSFCYLPLNNYPQYCPRWQYILIFTITTNSFVNNFIYRATSFDPKFRPSSSHDTRTWNIYTANKSVSWQSPTSIANYWPRSQTRWRTDLPKFFQLIQTWNHILTSSFITLYILHEFQFCRTWHLLLFTVLPQFNLKAEVTVVADSSPTFTHYLTVMQVYYGSDSILRFYWTLRPNIGACTVYN